MIIIAQVLASAGVVLAALAAGLLVRLTFSSWGDRRPTRYGSGAQPRKAAAVGPRHAGTRACKPKPAAQERAGGVTPAREIFATS